MAVEYLVVDLPQPTHRETVQEHNAELQNLLNHYANLGWNLIDIHIHIPEWGEFVGGVVNFCCVFEREK